MRGPDALKHTYTHEQIVKIGSRRSGQIAEWLKALATLVEDRGLIPSTHVKAYIIITPAPGVPHAHLSMGVKYSDTVLESGLGYSPAPPNQVCSTFPLWGSCKICSGILPKGLNDSVRESQDHHGLTVKRSLWCSMLACARPCSICS